MILGDLGVLAREKTFEQRLCPADRVGTQNERRKMSIRSIVKFVGAGVLALAIAGCASYYQITTNPDGASVLVNGVSMGQTPTELSFYDSGLKEITVEKDGYQKASTTVTPQVGGESHEVHFDLVAERKEAGRTIIEVIEGPKGGGDPQEPRPCRERGH